MRRAFTLVELMIAIVLTTIFLNFVFKFYNNVAVELRYLEAKDMLTYNACRTLQIVKNGVYGNGSNYINGLITLQNFGSDNNFTSHSGNVTKISTNSGLLEIMNTTGHISYTMQDINVSNFTLEHVKKGLYLIDFNASKESKLKFSDLGRTEIIEFQRLVYTK
jgi:prepilin-type N-terminal cleavage/methylation domain-containing protein